MWIMWPSRKDINCHYDRHLDRLVVLRLTSHHGEQAGLVDVGEGAQLSNSQDGLHVGVTTGLPKLADLVIHGCRPRQEKLNH